MLHQSARLTGVIASGALMMETIPSRFGDITVDTGKAVSFPRGLLGMPDKSRFVLTGFPSPKMQQFMLLQSLEEQALSFITLPLDVRNTIIAENDIKAACRDLQIDRSQSGAAAHRVGAPRPRPGKAVGQCPRAVADRRRTSACSMCSSRIIIKCNICYSHGSLVMSHGYKNLLLPETHDP